VYKNRRAQSTSVDAPSGNARAKGQLRAVDGALSPRQLQDLAAVWGDLQRVAPGVWFELSCTLIMRGEMPPGVRQGLAALLRQVRPDGLGWPDAPA
jgi:hypothetical protein